MTTRPTARIASSLVTTGELIVPGEKTMIAPATLSASTIALIANTRQDSAR